MVNKITLLFPQGKEKALTLSYDDGVDTDARMIELLEKYGVKCTFNLNAGVFGEEGAVRPANQIHFRLPESKVKTLYNHPLCEVATHGYTHPFLDQLPPAACMAEVIDDRRALEALFGRVIRGHAYPFGTYNDTVVDILEKAGIVYARTIESHHSFKLPQDWLRMGATCHHTEPELEALTDRFVNGTVGNQDGWLFYLWGHTYEFRQQDNWQRIERFFEKTARNEHIWYATNIEVYDYVTAWRRLVYSADASQVHNPSATDVWLKAGDRAFAVAAGATVCLAASAQ